MSYFLQQLVNGLTLGSMYGLIAIGYSMVYGIIGMINFAHGEIYMIGAFLSIIVFTLLGMIGLTWVPLALVTVLIVSMLITAAYGWSVEQIAYRPLRGSFRLAPLISAIGMSIFLQNFVQITQGANVKPLPPKISGGFVFGAGSAFPVQIGYTQIFVILLTLGLMLGFSYLIGRTPLGRSQRACEQDLKMAGLCGVNVDRTISLTFVMGAALAAVAGLMAALYYGVVDFFIGFLAGREGVHGSGARRHRLDPRRHAGRPRARADRGILVGLLQHPVQGCGRFRHPGGGPDLPADGPRWASPRSRRSSGMASTTAATADRPLAGMAPALKDALLTAFVAFVLLAPMLGMRTTSGPTGMTLEFHFERGLPPDRDRVRRPAGARLVRRRQAAGSPCRRH